MRKPYKPILNQQEVLFFHCSATFRKKAFCVFENSYQMCSMGIKNYVEVSVDIFQQKVTHHNTTLQPLQKSNCNLSTNDFRVREEVSLCII
jgi:hypothetical protein